LVFRGVDGIGRSKNEKAATPSEIELASFMSKRKKLSLEGGGTERKEKGEVCVETK